MRLKEKHCMNSAKMQNVHLWLLVDALPTPACIAADDICIKSAESRLLLKCALTPF